MDFIAVVAVAVCEKRESVKTFLAFCFLEGDVEFAVLDLAGLAFEGGGEEMLGLADFAAGSGGVLVEVVLLAEGYVGGLAEVVHEGEAGEAFYAAGGGVGGFAAGGAVEAGVFVGVEDIRVEAFGADEVVVLDCVVLAELDVACVVVEGRGVLLDVSACGADEGVAGGAGELDGGVAGGAFGTADSEDVVENAEGDIFFVICRISVGLGQI